MLIWLHLFIGTRLSLRKTHAMEVRHTRADYSHPVMRSRISVASIQRQVFEYWDALLIGICLSVSLGRFVFILRTLVLKNGEMPSFDAPANGINCFPLTIL